MWKKAISALLAVFLLWQTAVLSFAKDSFFPESPANYSQATAKSKDQCKNAYAYLSTIMDARYIERVYDLIFRAQYRLTLFGGDNWKYLNSGEDTVLVEDSVLGNISIYASRGCNSYARYAAKYIRGLQGSLKRASDFLGKSQNYVPTSTEIQRFIERYADVGERILTGYYNNTLKTVRPHSLVFLGEDPQNEGFYFLCQDGDGNGQTMRYLSYDYLATRLRYYAEYGYALAIGDTNSGKDTVDNAPLFGAVNDSIYDKLRFSPDSGYTTNISGWALSRTGSSVRVCGYVDGALTAQATATSNAHIQSVFPVWDTTGKSGFSLSMNMSAFSTGSHVLEICAESDTDRVCLKRVSFYVNNLVYALESPSTTESVILTPSAMTISLTGWGFDRSGEPVSFLFSVDGNTPRSLTPQDRPDVFNMPGCMYQDCGFSLTLDFSGAASGKHSIQIYARCAQEDVCIATLSLNVLQNPVVSKQPVLLHISALPDCLEYDYAQPLSLEGLILEVVYSDQSSAFLSDGYTYTASTLAPGKQPVKLSYAGLSAEFDILVHDPVAPQNISLTVPSSVLARSRTMQIIPTVSPQDAQAYSVVWKSSNPSVATVDDNGLVKGVSRGECEITAVVCDYYGNQISQDSAVIRVQSAFRIFWNKIWQRFLWSLGLQNKVSNQDADAWWI